MQKQTINWEESIQILRLRTKKEKENRACSFVSNCMYFKFKSWCYNINKSIKRKYNNNKFLVRVHPKPT